MKDEMEWKKKFTGCAEQMKIDPVKKERALYGISQAACAGSLQYRPTVSDMIKVQFSCIPGSIWAFQLLFLALLPFAEYWLQNRLELEGWQIFSSLSVWAAAGSLVFVSELARHFSCKMAELEQTCYLNLSQLWLLRACCISGLDILVIAAFGGWRAESYGFGWFSFTVYVLTPFFASNVILIFLFTKGRRGGRAVWFWAALLAGLGFWIQAECSWIYEAAWLPVWLLLLTAAIALWTIELRAFCRKMEGEGLCLN